MSKDEFQAAAQINKFTLTEIRGCKYTQANCTRECWQKRFEECDVFKRTREVELCEAVSHVKDIESEIKEDQRKEQHGALKF
jgi:CRISPR/Cas system CSM-associated protein Csm4 (group 5 of RAMP superfamily)